mmetsp:Transcript_18976/g.56883  ORF Transcript_18976/g.56883 Transcript_18976/m.56883 type:complete len:260 (+) Transcript_18976:509-1288(+)
MPRWWSPGERAMTLILASTRRRRQWKPRAWRRPAVRSAPRAEVCWQQCRRGCGSPDRARAQLRRRAGRSGARGRTCSATGRRPCCASRADQRYPARWEVRRPRPAPRTGNVVAPAERSAAAAETGHRAPGERGTGSARRSSCATAAAARPGRHPASVASRRRAACPGRREGAHPRRATAAATTSRRRPESRPAGQGRRYRGLRAGRVLPHRGSGRPCPEDDYRGAARGRVSWRSECCCLAQRQRHVREQRRAHCPGRSW